MKGTAIQYMEQLDEELRRAAKKGDARGMRALINQGAGVAKPDETGWTPLMLAATSGRSECIEMLLPLVDPSPRTDAKTTPLMLCAEAGWAEGVRLLLAAIDRAAERQGARNAPPAHSPVGRRCEWGRTALMLAAKAANAECVRLLLPLSNANAADFEGKTALMWAAQAQNGDPVGCVDALFPASVPAKRDKGGGTALHLAALSGRAQTVERLADLIDPVILDSDGKTAFDAAAGRLGEDGDRVRQTLRRAMAEHERREIDAAVGKRRFADAASLRPLAL